jgi:hypothetical protein
LITQEIEMNLTLKPLTAVAFALLLGSVNALAADPVSESFDRMLGHEPGPAIPATATDRDADPLIHAMILPLRNPARSSPPATDPIAESFARMLAYAPSTVAPPVPSSQGPDPLTVAMVEPLRRSLSESAEATHFATARSAAAGH